MKIIASYIVTNIEGGGYLFKIHETNRIDVTDWGVIFTKGYVKEGNNGSLIKITKEEFEELLSFNW